MTTARTGVTKQQRKLRISGVGQLCFLFFCAFCILLIFKNPEIAIEYMISGLQLCAKSVIPSLFPFMVLSEMLVAGRIADRIPKKLLAPMQHLLGLSPVGCCNVLLGMLCGFPVGAKCTVLAHRGGMISREEAERTLTFSSNPSSAFLISAVGVSLWENRRFGVVLYVTVLLASLISGILANLLRTDKEDRVSEIPVSSVPYPKLRWAQIFTGAVGSATGGILLVCAYVIFFSALIGTLNYVLGAFHLPDAVHATIFCLFELSGGVSRASALGNAVLGALLCAFAAGWSGLSVHCQILSVCDGSGLSLRPYFAAKFLQGGLCVLLLALFLFIDPTLLIPSVGI